MLLHGAGHLGDFLPSQTVYAKFNTVNAALAPVTLAGTPAVKIYKGNSTSTEVTTGVTLAVDFDSLTGLHHLTVDLSADTTFYAAGGDFQAILTAGTADSISQVGSVVASFSVSNRAASKQLPGIALATGLVVTDGGNSSLRFKTDLASSVANYPRTLTCYFTSGALAGQARMVKEFNGTTKFVRVDSSYSAAPSNGDRFVLLP